MFVSVVVPLSFEFRSRRVSAGLVTKSIHPQRSLTSFTTISSIPSLLRSVGFTREGGAHKNNFRLYRSNHV